MDYKYDNVYIKESETRVHVYDMSLSWVRLGSVI